MNRSVLQPQQLQRHALVALKLPVDVAPVRLRPGNPRRRRGREQRRLQRGVVQPLGNGQEKPATLARRTYSLTVLLAMPSDAAISRWLRPSSYFRRSSSRTLPHGQPLL